MKTVKTVSLYMLCLMPLTIFVTFISCNKSYVMDVHARMPTGNKASSVTVEKQKTDSLQLLTDN
jgi:hypothetical protein